MVRHAGREGNTQEVAGVVDATHPPRLGVGETPLGDKHRYQGGEGGEARHGEDFHRAERRGNPVWTSRIPVGLLDDPIRSRSVVTAPGSPMDGVAWRGALT